MTQRRQTPPLSRGEARPVRRRTRTFRPNYLSFAGTYQCNLACPHCCVPIEWPDRLDVVTALRFLEDAHAYGIGTLGFTGGEPFLHLESELSALAATGFRGKLGLSVDKFHGAHTAKAAEFCRAARRVFGRDNIV